MKIKTINNVIENKINSWLKTIEGEIKKDLKKKNEFGENFHAEISSHIMVTGGCITSLLLGEEVNDFDVYFDSIEICEKVLKFYSFHNSEIKESKNGLNLFVDFFKASKKNSPSVFVLSATSNAITLSNDIQIITRFVGTPEEIHKNFDFVHTKNYWYKNKLVLNQDALESIITKELRYVGSLYPVSSIFRLKKFVARGWSITAGEMFKITWDISKLDLSDIEVLKDQLVGVDISYFNSVIDELRKNNYTTLDRNYLFGVIDKIFNS